MIKKLFARSVAIVLTCVLIPEGIILLLWTAKNIQRFQDSVQESGAPTWYYLHFAIVKTVGALLLWTACWQVWVRVLKDPPELFGGRSKKKLTASEVATRVYLFAFFFTFAFLVAPLTYLLGELLHSEQEADWVAGIPITLACLSYLLYLFYPFRKGKRAEEE